jgi:hypothetical protein
MKRDVAIKIMPSSEAQKQKGPAAGDVTGIAILRCEPFALINPVLPYTPRAWPP